MRRLLAAAFVCTILFYVEYTDLWRKVHIPYDIEGYHYSLSDAIFLSLKNHQLPLWDSWNYSGIPLAANIQAALFYPPSWVMYAAHLPFSKRLPYSSMELFVIVHIWLAFALFYLWLRRGRGLHEVASILGAMAFAYSGYVTSQITHLGLVCNYAWFPLGFWGIDDIARGRARRGIVKLTIAAAFGLLAGYPATWMSFAVAMFCYGLTSARNAAFTTLALGWAVALSAVQLLPTIEASPMKLFDPKYARFSGMKDITYFYAYLVPNLWDFELGVHVDTNPGKEYLYLGAVGIAGLLLFLLAFRHVWRSSLPLLSAFAGTLLFMVNPFGWPGYAIEKSHTLSQIFADWYFLAGFGAILAAFAAIGIDHFLTRPVMKRHLRAAWVAAAAAFAWTAYLLSIWLTHWRPFTIGWASAVDAAVGVTLVLALLACLRVCDQRQYRVVLSALLLLGMVEYKVFGTSKRVNSMAGASTTKQSKEHFFGFSEPAWQRLQQQHPMRVTVDEWGPFATDWRHVQLAVPNGFDPFLPTAYRQLIEDRKGVFTSNRIFKLPPDPETLRLFGVGHYITSENSALYKELLANPNFKMYESENDYFKVFELKDAKPPYAFSTVASIRIERWIPERRRFEIDTDAAGTFRLSEQFYPGWRATVDRKPVTLSKCETAFQCVDVPAGKHMVEFVYRPMSLLIGLGISVVATLALARIALSQISEPRS